MPLNSFISFTLFFTLSLFACSCVLTTDYSEYADNKYIPRTAMTINLAPDDGIDQKQLGWIGFFKKHFPSLLLTSAVGVITGTISASIVNKKILSWPISWLLLWSTRNVAVNAIIQDMRTYKVPHNKKLAFISARLADWVAYLVCRKVYAPRIIS